MDWPIEDGWQCETCERKVVLEWMAVHGICRCTACGTVYNMGTVEDKRAVPKNIMNSPEATKIVWGKTHADVFDAPDDLWAEAYELHPAPVAWQDEEEQ